MTHVLSLQKLENIFKEAKKYDAKYIGILIEMPGFAKPEIIINQMQNFDKKLEYYRQAYNSEELTLKANNDIKIIDCSYGNTFDCLEYDLIEIHNN